MGVGLGRLIRHPALGPIRRRAKAGLIGASEGLLGKQALQGRFGQDGFYSLTIPGLAGPYLLTRGRITVGGWAVDLARGAALPWRVRLDRRVIPAEPVERADVVEAFSRMAELPLRCGGLVSTRLSSGPHYLRVEAETGPGTWTSLFRCFAICRDSDIGFFDSGDISRYPEWRAREVAVADADAAGQRAYAALVGFRPSVTAVVEGSGGPARAATLASLEEQTYAGWTAILVGGAAEGGAEASPSLAAAIGRAGGDYVLPLRAGDRLAPDALYHLAAAAQADPGLDIVYADEEVETEGEEPSPVFKSAWSPDTLESFDYLGAPSLFRTALARQVEPESAYDLALRVAERTRRVGHVRKVLCRRERDYAGTADPAADMRALAGRLERTGRRGTVSALEGATACFRLDVTPPRPDPLVSIVIPTAGRDLDVRGDRRDLVTACVRDIRERSTYRNVEVVVVVNPDLPRSKSETLEALGCRTVLFDEPAFNVARKLNLGASAASGEYLLLLNDDVAVISPDWIERLLAQAAKPHVGVVGGKLLYPDDTVQHAGVVTLHGNPNHVRRGFPDPDLGYRYSSASVRNYGAVTGACMLTRSELYRQVGGFSEEFPVHFNDVDYCFKLRRLGLHVVYEPACRLYHFESASRRPGIGPEELSLFQRRWAQELVDDPFYPNHAFGTAPPTFDVFMRARTNVP